MKLHLGCGQRYLEGYLNIDFPPSEHTVQSASVADIHVDLLELTHPPETVDEIRLHHVFEHFPRPIACALLTTWYAWLCPGGILRLEVPDFTRSAYVILNPFSTLQAKAVAERHLYGSHEASWGVHCEGYTLDMLKKIITTFGFVIKDVRRNCWLGTYNIEIIAVKGVLPLNFVELRENASRYLELFLVDDNSSERSLHQVWLDIYTRQTSRGLAQNV